MPADNQEVLDDFIMDMDIETITLDDMQVKESDKGLESQNPEMVLNEQANNQFFGDMKMNNVNIEEIKLGDPSGGSSQKPFLGGENQNVTINIEHASIQGDIKGDIHGDVIGDVKGGVREKISRGKLTETPEVETPPSSFSDVPEVDIPDFGSMNSSGQLSMNTGDEDFLKNVESDITLGELNKIEETPEPSIPQEMPMDDNASAFDSVPEVPEVKPIEALKDDAVFSSEDDIIFIDGSELDKLVYGHGNNAAGSINDVPVIDEIAAEKAQDDLIPPEEKEETISINDFHRKETIPLAEEVITEEEPVSSLDIQPLDEGIIRENDTAVEQIEIDLGAPAPAEPEFNFDLSVIPDVEMVEEDEPIALSIDELNNIDISDDTVMGFDASAVPENTPLPADEDEPIAISLDELNEIQKDISPVQSKEEKTRFIEQQLESLSGQSKDELKSVLSYLDKLLEDLPEDRIKEFAKSDYYDLYVKILDKLGV